MEHVQYVEAIRREGAALAAAAQKAGVDAPVPSCPEWSVADLLSHLGRIHRWVTAIVEERPGATEEHWSKAEPPPPAERVDWFAAGVDPLADALAAAGPAKEVWTWTEDHSSGFWARRQANETAVHRWDAQNAAGAAAALHRELAIDGVDEFLGLLPTWRFVDQLRDLDGSIHLHCTDGEGEWLVRLAGDVTMTREHAKGDVAVRGGASDLMLVLTGRARATTIEVFGDQSLLDRFLEQARF